MREILPDNLGVTQITAALFHLEHFGNQENFPLVVSSYQFERIVKRRAERLQQEERRIQAGLRRDGRRTRNFRYEQKSLVALERHKYEESMFSGRFRNIRCKQHSNITSAGDKITVTIPRNVDDAVRTWAGGKLLRDLTIACRCFGLKTSGNKAALVDRLAFHVQSSPECLDKLQNMASSRLAAVSSESLQSQKRTCTAVTKLGLSQGEFEINPILQLPTDMLNQMLSFLKDLDPFNETKTVLTCTVPRVTLLRFHCDDLLSLRRSGHSVWIRSCRYHQSTSKMDISWSEAMSLSLNNMPVLNVEPPRPLKKRKEDPIDVTHLCRSADNTLSVQAANFSAAYASAQFLTGAFLCRPVSDKEIIDSIVVEPMEACRDRVRGLLQNSSNDDLDCLEPTEGDAYRLVDLTCPLSLLRITSLPLRTKNCHHLKCFDSSSFLYSTRKTPIFSKRWKCPICRVSATPPELVIDSFFKGIIDSTCANEVMLYSDCRWSEIDLVPDEPPSPSEREQSQANDVDVIYLDDGDEIIKNETTVQPLDRVLTERSKRRCNDNRNTSLVIDLS